MELTPYFKSYIDSDKQPIVICDIDCHIVYINPAAAKEFEKFGGYDLVGRQLRALTSIEGESKINMLVELFKESNENDTLFVCRDTKKNIDTYVVAVRDENGKLIGFAGRKILRTPDTAEPYDII